MKSIAEVKASILQSIADCDHQKLLLEIEAFIKDLKETRKAIIGYTATGEPLTVKEYQESIAEAQAQYKAGKTISQKDLETKLQEGLD